MTPLIETQRLLLRPHEKRDFARYAAFWATDASRFMGGPLDRDAAWGEFCIDVAADRVGEGRSWMIDTLDGETVGQVAICHPPKFPEREIGWLIYPEYQRKGYALEAAQAVLADYYRSNTNPLVSYIDPENAASIDLARTLGAQRDLDAAFPDQCDMVFRHPKPEPRDD